LAYPIQKKSTGFYCLFEFKGEPTIVKKLETAYRRDERVLRFLTFRLDKYAAEYAEKRRKNRASKANEEPAVVTVETKED
jgi:small subunit ribosomal protein S6